MMTKIRNYILEMSYPAKLVKMQMAGFSLTLAKHVFLMYAAKKTSNLNYKGWKKEVFTWFRDVSDMKVKPKNKLLSQATYFEYLYTHPLNVSVGWWEKRLPELFEDKGVDFYFSSDEELATFLSNVKSFYVAVCSLIAKNQFSKITFDQAEEKCLK